MVIKYILKTIWHFHRTNFLLLSLPLLWTDGQADRRMDGGTDRQTDCPLLLRGKNPKNHSVATVYIHTISQQVSLACTLLSLQIKHARPRQHKRHWLQNEQMSFVFERLLTSNILMTSFVFLSPHDITAGDIFIGRFSINSCNSLIGAKWYIQFPFTEIHVQVRSNQGCTKPL